MTVAELFLKSAQCLVEHEKAIKAANAKLEVLEARLRAIEERQADIEAQYHSIMDYAGFMGIRGVDSEAVAVLEKKARRLSNKQGYGIGRKYADGLGFVNTYHVDILQMVFRSDDE